MNRLTINPSSGGICALSARRGGLTDSLSAGSTDLGKSHLETISCACQWTAANCCPRNSRAGQGARRGSVVFIACSLHSLLQCFFQPCRRFITHFSIYGFPESGRHSNSEKEVFSPKPKRFKDGMCSVNVGSPYLI